jgi:hypothetical protein
MPVAWHFKDTGPGRNPACGRQRRTDPPAGSFT